MSIPTKGTSLYVVDPDGGGTGIPAVLKVGCTTTISGVTASRSQIDETCLESEGMEYTPGLPDPGTATFGINFDPRDPSHIRVHQMFVDGIKADWALGWGDGTDDPSGLDSSGDMILPTTRTWLTTEAYPSDVPFDFSINSIVKSSVSLQLSGLPVLVPKVITP